MSGPNFPVSLKKEMFYKKRAIVKAAAMSVNFADDLQSGSFS